MIKTKELKKFANNSKSPARQWNQGRTFLSPMILSFKSSHKIFLSRDTFREKKDKNLRDKERKKNKG